MPKTAVRTKEKGNPQSVTILPKNKAVAKKSNAMPARTIKELEAGEANEGEAKSLRGAINGRLTTVEQEVVGSNYSRGNFNEANWEDAQGFRLFVDFWFPTCKAAIDYPDSKEQYEFKVALFKKLKVPYVGVLPGEPLNVETARQQLKAQGATILI